MVSCVSKRGGRFEWIPLESRPKGGSNPGQQVRFEGAVHRIVFMYRLQENPQEWIYALEVVAPDHLGERLLGVS